MEPVNVVLDIDGVLCCNSVRSKEAASFYLRKGAIISAIKTHYVFPGVIEFLQLLFRTENIRVSFFSSGDRQRNEMFVEEILKCAIGKEGYEKVQKSVVILSREHMVSNTDHNSKAQYQTYGLTNGNKKKDVSKVLRDDETLQNTVLIDDDHSYIQYGQEKNVLKVPGADNRDYRGCEYELEAYTEEGYKEIPCSLLMLVDEEQEPGKGYKKEVVSGDKILVFKNEVGYQIGFLSNQSNQYEQRMIPVEEKKWFISSLDEILDIKSTEKSREIELNNTDQLEYIRSFVDHFGGKTRRIYREINRICYIAGLLFKSMEVAQQECVPLTEVLFRWQYKKKIDSFKPNFRKLASHQQFYLFGLEKLRQVNSNFSLTTPKSYFHCIKLPIGEEEDKLLEEAVSNEGGCVIM